ncbi:MAG: hypothetical protein IPF73_17445 [Betaproteobacteria bacterium]|nr:hypothetical protein [Betaproteobacteria bacterium]
MHFTIFRNRAGARRINQVGSPTRAAATRCCWSWRTAWENHAGGEIAARICVRLFIERFQRKG